MTIQIVLPVLARFLHDLFTAVWIGGLITLGAAVLPSIKKQGNKELAKNIQKRLNTIVIVSIIGLWLTGMLLANRSSEFAGFFSISNTYSLVMTIKHALVVLMTIFALARTTLVVRKKETTPKTEKIGAVLLIGNIVLGVTVLLLSGYTATIANLPIA